MVAVRGNADGVAEVLVAGCLLTVLLYFAMMEIGPRLGLEL